MQGETGQRQDRSWRALSGTVLVVVLLASAIGAVSLVRQRPVVQPPPPPPPAWSGAGHDPAHTGHSLSYPAPVATDQITLLWRRPFRPGEPRPARRPVIDGVGNVYLSLADGALLALANGDGHTNWCAAEQPVADTTCTAPAPAPAPPHVLPPPAAPNAMVGPDERLYVVGSGGRLVAYDPSSARPLWSPTNAHLVPDDGVVYDPNTYNTDPYKLSLYLYGVTTLAPRSSYAVVALHVGVRQHGVPRPGWTRTPIHTRGLTPVSVAPDGTVLVAASAPHSGGNAMLYALDTHGRVRWRVSLAPGRPSYVSVQKTDTGWNAWLVVSGNKRSWVFVTDQRGRSLWRWSVGHPLDVVDGGVALAHSVVTRTSYDNRGYVGSTVGVYALDLRRHHSWLFFSTRALGRGTPGPPATDVSGTVYFATGKGNVYAVRPDGTVHWRYDTGRNARGALALDPHGAVVVLSRGAVAGTVAEELGANGLPLATAVPVPTTSPATPAAGTPRPGHRRTGATPAATALPALYCAVPDCPTSAPTPSPTITPLSTATPPPTITPLPTATPLPTRTPLATRTPSPAQVKATPTPTVVVSG